MRTGRGVLKRLFHDEDGLETIEYALIMGLVSVGTIAILAAIGAWANSSLQQVSGELDDALPD